MQIRGAPIETKLQNLLHFNRHYWFPPRTRYSLPESLSRAITANPRSSFHRRLPDRGHCQRNDSPEDRRVLMARELTVALGLTAALGSNGSSRRAPSIARGLAVYVGVAPPADAFQLRLRLRQTALCATGPTLFLERAASLT